MLNILLVFQNPVIYPFCRFPWMNFLYLANINSMESECSAASKFSSTKASVDKSREENGSVVLLVSAWSVNYRFRPLQEHGFQLFLLSEQQ